MLVCLMPLSQYKKNELYRHIELFELADPKLFEDAVITENLCICTLKKEYADKYGWMDLVLKSIDQRYIEFYKWNIEHYKGLAWTEVKNKAASSFNVDYDFLETSRCVTECGGGRFGPASFGYAWNVLKNTSSVNARMTYLHFLDSKSKQNFVKYIYSWTSSDKRDQTLNYKALIGMKTDGPSREYYFGIPQIDWSNIHINQKELWDKGLYDDAVLNEMGLKWNADKTVIIKDE